MLHFWLQFSSNTPWLHARSEVAIQDGSATAAKCIMFVLNKYLQTSATQTLYNNSTIILSLVQTTQRLLHARAHTCGMLGIIESSTSTCRVRRGLSACSLQHTTAEPGWHRRHAMALASICPAAHTGHWPTPSTRYLYCFPVNLRIHEPLAR
jgi:hypothetical protein